jgi:hypothetical protein
MELEHHQIVLASGRLDASGFNPINRLSFKTNTLGGLTLSQGEIMRRGKSHGGAFPSQCALTVALIDPARQS